MIRHTTLAALLVLAALLPAAPSHGAKVKTFKMVTKVEDFVTTEWTLECPDGRKIDLTRTDLTEEGGWELMPCINEIEAAVGIQIESRTKVKDFVVESDRISSVVEMSEAKAAKLCGIIDDHRIPDLPIPRSRPSIRSTVVNFETVALVIDCGNGKVIDLLSAPLEAGLLANVLAWIADLEQTLGVQVTSTTQAGGEDRIHAVSNLTEEQKEQILMFLASQGVAVPPEDLVFPFRMSCRVKIKANGEKVKVDLEGSVVLRQQGPLPAPGEPVPYQVVGLQAMGQSDLGPVQIQADPGGQARLGATSEKKARFSLDTDLDVQIPDAGFAANVVEPLQLSGKTKIPPKPEARLKADGKRALEGRESQGSLKVKRFELMGPGRANVFFDPGLIRR